MASEERQPVLFGPDLAVTCGEHTFHVHRAVISAISGAIRAELEKDPKVSIDPVDSPYYLGVAPRTKRTSSLSLGTPNNDPLLFNDNAEDVNAVLYFGYYHCYPSGTLAHHARMFVLAEKYSMSTMQSYAVENFNGTSFTIVDYARAVKILYSDNKTDPGQLLKTAILERSSQHAGKWNASDAVFHEVVENLAEYRKDLMHERSKGVTSGRDDIIKRYRCPGDMLYGQCQGTVTLNAAKVYCKSCDITLSEKGGMEWRPEYWQSRGLNVDDAEEAEAEVQRYKCPGSVLAAPSCGGTVTLPLGDRKVQCGVCLKYWSESCGLTWEGLAI